jgi:hypothetical protein
MLISFSFRSDYARFKRLLAAFEVNPRWLVVRDVGLSRDSETVGEVQVRLALATYFSNEDRRPVLPGPPAAPAGPAARKSVRSVERTVQR